MRPDEVRTMLDVASSKLNTALRVVGDVMDELETMASEMRSVLHRVDIARRAMSSADAAAESDAPTELADRAPAPLDASAFDASDTAASGSMKPATAPREPPPGVIAGTVSEQAADEAPFSLTPPEPAAVPKPKQERPLKPIPADWAPSSATRIRLATLGIDAGPNSATVAEYRQAMQGVLRKTWGDRDFETWAKDRKRAAEKAQQGAA